MAHPSTGRRDLKILVTGANGDIGEAVGRILREELPSATVVGSDCAGRWPGQFVFDEMIELPLASAPEYGTALRDAARGFDIIIPTSEPELAYLATGPQATAGLPLLMAAPGIVTTFLDKYDTSRLFEREGVPAPRTWLASQAPVSELPLYLKPRRGAGGRGHRRIATPYEHASAAREFGDGWVMQELLEGESNEYTCALVRLDGKTRHLIMRRKLQGDRTTIAEVQNLPAVASLLENLATRIDLDGCINVQLKVTDEGPRVFEVNPRLSSTVMMRHRMGFTDCAWWVRARLGLPAGPYTPPPEGTVAYRMSREHVRAAKEGYDG